MSLFGNLTNDGLEETQDRLGGFSVLDTDVYAGKIKMAYALKSKKGAQGVFLILELAGQEHRETVYITTQKGDNFYVKDGKKHALPGFSTVNDLCQVSTDKPLADQAVEEKIVNVYDPELKKEMPKSVPVIVDLIGKDCLVAIQRSTVDKTTLQGDEYVPTGESKDENNIEKVFHPALRVSVVEAKAGKEAAFIDSWVERNRGKIRDKRQNKGDGVKSGRPGASAGAPQSGGGEARKSLFGKAA